MDISVLEDKLLQVVRDARFDVETVERYAGQLEQEIDQLPFSTSAIFAMYDGSDLKRADNRTFFEECALSTVVACRNLSGRGDAQVDAYALLQQLRDLLTNHRLGLDIEPMTPERIELVFVSGALCVYGIRWKTWFEALPPLPPQ